MNLITKKRKEFLGLPAPSGYVAGMGRGATGFTTRSDIGPARDDTDVPDERHLQHKRTREDEDNENLNDSNYDEFSGYGGNLCSKDPYEEDDIEADTIYENIDKHMDERRKVYREIREQKEIERYRRKRPKIQQNFVDLKRELKNVSFDDWKNIPEVGDSRNRKQRIQRPDSYLPKPDSLIAKEFSDNQVNTIDPRKVGGTTTAPGLQTPVDNIDMQRIGDARKLLMDSQLSRVSDSVTGQTVIDPKGYLTDLQSMLPQMSMNPSGSEVADIKKSRLLLNSIIESNPKKVSGWIAIVRFEEHFNKIHEAKQLVIKGCENCPDSEEMWLEAIRIMKQYGGNDNINQAKSVAAKAIKNVSNSVSLWVAAANLEETVKSKRIVYRKALEMIPDSVKLWKLTVELEEDPQEAKALLEGAVLCCATSVELWLALAKLNNPSEARTVLNNARQKIPNDRQIWITACKLEEAEGNEDKIELLIKRAIEVLKSNMVEINRDEWIKDAEEAERSGSKVTAQKIIQRVVSIGVDEQDRKHTWIADADSCNEHGCYECARAIYSVAISNLANKKSVWKRAAAFEKEHGTRENYEDILSRAVEFCPNVEVLWLMAAKSKWEAGDVENARNVLSKAFSANPNSEEIMLAAVKLESENNEFDRANRLLHRARTNVGTDRVWMKSARLEWCLGNLDSAENLLLEAVEKFPKYAKLWMMLGQVREQKGAFEDALKSYKDGSMKNPDSIPLWSLQANLEEKQGFVSKARNTLEKAKAKNIEIPELWLASIRLELRANNLELVNNLMSRALQHCPNSGILWAESVNIVPKKNRLAKAREALLKCEHSEHVLVAAAKVFWENGHEKKAREWLTKAIKVEKLFGDAWAYLYKLDTIYGTESQREEIMTRCVMAEPRFGEFWCPISKDVANWKLKTKDILPLVAAKLPLPK